MLHFFATDLSVPDLSDLALGIHPNVGTKAVEMLDLVVDLSV